MTAPRQPDAPARANRSPAVEAVRARQDEIGELIYVRCFSHGRIVREMSREWGMSERQIFRYIRSVEERFGRANANDPGVTRARYREMLVEKIKRYEEAGTPAHIAAASRFVEALGRIDGAIADRLDVKHSGTVAHLHATPAELAALSDGEIDAVRAFHAAREQRLLGPSIADAEVIEPPKGS